MNQETCLPVRFFFIRTFVLASIRCEAVLNRISWGEVWQGQVRIKRNWRKFYDSAGLRNPWENIAFHAGHWGRGDVLGLVTSRGRERKGERERKNFTVASLGRNH